MRSEQDMFDLIIKYAKENDDVLAVYLKGSKTNPNIKKDIYQDFDIMYVVKDCLSFVKDTSWLNRFGNIILKQEQKDEYGFGHQFNLRKDYDQLYSWLLIFDDCNRIDIGIETLSHYEQGKTRNKLHLPLLDKINCLIKNDEPSDVDFHIKSPTKEQYFGCTNEFYWSLCEVLKGIARDELPYAMSNYFNHCHMMLELMIQWSIGIDYNFKVSSGKNNKFFKKYLSNEQYQLFTLTYPSTDYLKFIEAINNGIKMFKYHAIKVGEEFNYNYQNDVEHGFNTYYKFIMSNINNN